MYITKLFLAASFTAVMAANAPVVSKNAINVHKVNEEIQSTTISPSGDKLKQPHILRVKTDTTETILTGTIKLNGSVFQPLSNSNTQVDLSLNLPKGRHIIEIEGNYSPPNASVNVELTAPLTQVIQQMGSSGKLNQTFTIDVR